MTPVTALCIDRFRLGRKAVPRNGVIAPGDWRRRKKTLSESESESVQSAYLTTMQDQLLLGPVLVLVQPSVMDASILSF